MEYLVFSLTAEECHGRYILFVAFFLTYIKKYKAGWSLLYRINLNISALILWYKVTDNI